jgi:hypothetical protein
VLLVCDRVPVGGMLPPLGWHSRSVSLTVQHHADDNAALCVAEQPDGDGNGAGRGRRRREPQGQLWVRSQAVSSCRWFVAAEGAYDVPHSDGAAGGPLRLCRNTALHYASMNGHTETAKAVVKVGADVDCKNTYG